MRISEVTSCFRGNHHEWPTEHSHRDRLTEPEAYRRDVRKAEVHVLDAGHFALDTAADEIADLVRRFMSNRQ